LTRQAQARSKRQGAGRGSAREQQAHPRPLGPRGSGRADRRRSGTSGGRRSKPTATTAGLAWWKVSGQGAPRGSRRDPEAALRGARSRGSEPAASSPARDRERQKLVRTVRLPQPMGAGGRRPPEGPLQGDLRAAPVRDG